MEKRLHSKGYVLVKLPDHPRASAGWVYEHILVAERALGRPLPLTACVHHVNEQRDDNRPCNLVICENNAYHKTLHQRLAALNICGHAEWVKCDYCGVYDDPSSLYLHHNGKLGRHKLCAIRYRAERRDHFNACRRKNSLAKVKSVLPAQPNQKLCKCGCGGPTSLIKTTDTRKGYVKGEYYDYRHGHAARKPA